MKLLSLDAKKQANYIEDSETWATFNFIQNLLKPSKAKTLSLDALFYLELLETDYPIISRWLKDVAIQLDKRLPANTHRKNLIHEYKNLIDVNAGLCVSLSFKSILTDEIQNRLEVKVQEDREYYILMHMEKGQWNKGRNRPYWMPISSEAEEEFFGIFY